VARAEHAIEIIDSTDQLNERASVRVAFSEVLRAAGRAEHANLALAEAGALFELKGNLTGAALCMARV
jgi:hypothetical protein